MSDMKGAPSKLHQDGVRAVQSRHPYLKTPPGTGALRRNSLKSVLCRGRVEWDSKFENLDSESMAEYMEAYIKCPFIPDLWGVVPNTMMQHQTGLLLFVEVIHTNRVSNVKIGNLAHWAFGAPEDLGYEMELRIYSCRGVMVEFFDAHDLDFMSLFSDERRDEYRILIAKERDLVGPIAGVR